MERDAELESLQDAIEATDEEVAARARKSTKTFHRAKKGLVPPETRQDFVEALDSLRLEKIQRLTKLKCKAVG